MTGPIHPMVPLPLNTPSKPQVQGAAIGRNQKDRRYNDTFFDQHRHPKRFPNGRPWCGPREIAANHDLMHEDGFVMGDLMRGQYVETDDGQCDRAATLQSAWHAPWTPYAKYFRYNYKRKTIFLNYQQMRTDENEGLQRYYKAASKLGIQLNLRVEPGILPHPQIVSELGEPSRMIKIAEAAMAGDPWLLGFIDEPNPDLADILGIHPQSGILTNEYASYEPPEQIQKVEAIIAAPVNQDLLMMLAEMQKGMMALTTEVASLSAERNKKAEQSRKIKEGMAKRKQPTEAA